MKKVKEAHVSNTNKGMGDYYGTGIRNPIGKPIDIFGMGSTNVKSTNKPPKSLA